DRSATTRRRGTGADALIAACPGLAPQQGDTPQKTLLRGQDHGGEVPVRKPPVVVGARRQTGGVILPDTDTCYRAVQSHDARFDGWFFTAVRTTGIYCRPSCPAITPQRRNVTFYPSAAAAQRAGYRACKRCRPDAAPGSPEWNVRGDL